MKIETIAWVLPRPRKKQYIKGSFPLHFERRLLELLGFEPGTLGQMEFFDRSMRTRILHQFGGMAEFGLRMDVNESLEPDLIADAHALPFPDNTFDLVIVDPPYSDDLSKKIYGTGKLKYYTYVNEAVRVCKPGGFITLYHVVMLPRPKGTKYHKRIFLGIRIWHRLRCASIFQKLLPEEVAERGL